MELSATLVSWKRRSSRCELTQGDDATRGEKTKMFLQDVREEAMRCARQLDETEEGF